MKKFLNHLLLILIISISVMFIFDFLYTEIYKNSESRSKFQYFRSLKNKKVNYIFLGSSRVDNSIVPSVIKKKTNKETLNLGFQAARMRDIYTLLQLVKEYNIKYDTIFIQIDYYFNRVEKGCSNNLPYQMAPFIRESEITKKYLNEYVYESSLNYYFPFLRYCNYDNKIGFREVFSNLINKKAKVIENQGYNPITGHVTEEFILPKDVIKSNPDFDLIINFCKQNRMDVIFYTAPISKHSINLDYIKKLKLKIPNLIDFSSSIENDKMFKDSKHLNDDGAKLFTEILTDELLTKGNK